MRNQENLYWYMAYCRIVAGHDQEGLEWADRAVVAEGAVPSDREELLLSSRTAASFRLGDVNSAKRLAGQLNDHYPFDTWRGRVPNDRDSETDAHFAGYNLALRVRHAGYANVYWYRGGREAWEVAGLPETEVNVQEW